VGTIDIITVSISKVPDENAIDILLELSPSELTLWDTVDFADIIYASSPVPISNYKVTRNLNGTVTVTVQYAGDIQGKPIYVTVDPSKSNNPIFRLSHSSNATILVNPGNNQAAYNYPDYAYRLQSIISKVGSALSLAALGVFALGVISGKMVGVEMMAVIQISFLSLMTLDGLNPCFAAISSLKFVNGYNELSRLTSITDLFLPIPPKFIGLFSFFVNNLNFTLAIIVIPLLVAAVAFILSKTALKTNPRILTVA
jgi:hypothetical protein